MPMDVTISETDISGVLTVETQRFQDDRGYFTESYSKDVWNKHGFTQIFVQDNISKSRKGTLRGMHYQLEPDGMGKLVRCVTGAIFDVAVDLRKNSPTFGKWVGRELNEGNNLCLWVPIGFAHGFVALEDDTIVHYKCTEHHAPESERALSYRDPDIAIKWPIEPTVVSEKDETAPLLKDADTNFTWPGPGTNR